MMRPLQRTPWLVLALFLSRCSSDPEPPTDAAQVDVPLKDAGDDIAEASVSDVTEANTVDAADAGPSDGGTDAARDVTPDLAPPDAPDIAADVTAPDVSDAASDVVADASADVTDAVAVLDTPAVIDAGAVMDVPDASDASADRPDAATDAATPPDSAAPGMTAYTAIDLGSEHSCARAATGRVHCWGRNSAGQVGDGSMAASRNAPAVVATLATVTQVSAGGDSTCAVTPDGRAHCWGENSNGQLGNDSPTDAPTPVMVMNLDAVAEVSVGASHTCARRMDGTARCWGSNASGQLGNDSTTTSRTPVAVMGLTGVAEIEAGSSFSCARLSDGSVRCWGSNSSGRIGDGTTTTRRLPVAVTGLTDAVQLALGTAHACARRAGGTVVCWGSNTSGQLGSMAAGTTSSSTPVPVDGLAGVTDIAAEGNTTCALVGTVARCWGSNDNGQVGDGTRVDRASPVAVTLPGAGAALAVGDDHACAVFMNGRVACWGLDEFGQLGLGTARQVDPPVAVAGLTNARQLALGTDYRAHSCAVRADGTVACWGANTVGQLGDGTTNDRVVPAGVPGLTGVAEVAAGDFFTCARRTDNTVRCWGENGERQLGDGTTTDTSAPVAVTAFGATTLAQLAAGDAFVCVRTGDARVLCWGDADNRQLGTTTTTDSSTATAVMGVPPDVAQIALGGDHGCLRATSGSVYCWGDNDNGQLGAGAVGTDSERAVVVPGLTGATLVAAGNNHSCAVVAGGAVRCWGDNFYNQIGDGTTTDRPSPTAVPGLTGVVALASRGNFTCAMNATGRVQCWGFREQAVGSGTITNRPMPETIAGALGVVELATGNSHACFRRMDGVVLCGGFVGFGQIGNGATLRHFIPQLIP